MNIIIAIMFFTTIMPNFNDNINNIINSKTEHRITSYYTGTITADGTKIDYDKVLSGDDKFVAISQCSYMYKKYPYGSLIFINNINSFDPLIGGFYFVHDCTAKWVANKWPIGTIDILRHPTWDNQFREYSNVYLIFKGDGKREWN